MRNKKGFTMLELLIVLAIIAVLAAVAIPVYSAQMENVRKGVDEYNLRMATGLAAQDFLLRNAGKAWIGFSQNDQTSYAVLTYADSVCSEKADSKNILVFPVSSNDMYVNEEGILLGEGGRRENVGGIVYGYEKCRVEKEQRAQPLGTISGRDVCYYPIQQNGGNGYFKIVMASNGVVKESVILTSV